MSSNAKTAAKPSHGVVAVLKSLHFALLWIPRSKSARTAATVVEFSLVAI